MQAACARSRLSGTAGVQTQFGVCRLPLPRPTCTRNSRFFIAVAGRPTAPDTDEQAPQQVSRGTRRLLRFGGKRGRAEAPPSERVENTILPLPRGRWFNRLQEQPSERQSAGSAAAQEKGASSKAKTGQQNPQSGGSGANKRQAEPAMKGAEQKSATQQSRLRYTGKQVLPKASDEVLQESPAARFVRLYSKPAALVFASSHILATACAVTGIAASPPYLPPIVGAAVGGLFAALNRYGMVRFWREPTAPLRVVITGSTKGIGKALAREFLRAGDSVVVTARSPHGVRRAVRELQAEMEAGISVKGFDVDVRNTASVARLARSAKDHLGRVDVWINNAGYSGSFQSLLDAEPEQIVEVVKTNLLGTVLATRAAIQIMGDQPTGGHIFNMDGAGADGAPTPQYAAYGATKAGIAQLMRSLTAELEAAGSKVAVHTSSPGMVLTGLLLTGATLQNKQVFNILCEQPETVAAFLVPRMRTVVARDGKAQYIKYLTPARALYFFLNAPFRSRRFFDSEGERLYADEFDRMFGRQARRTQRLAAAAARRNSTLGLVYSLSMSGSFLLIVMFGALHTVPGP